MGSKKRIKVGAAVVAVLIILILIITLSVVLSKKDSTATLSGPLRIDCAPDQTTSVSRSVCEARGCVYVDETSNDPTCYFPDTSSPSLGYDVESHISALSALTNRYRLTSRGGKIYDDPVKSLSAIFQPLSNNILRVKIGDETAERYEVPISLNIPSTTPTDPKYNYELKSSKPFTFSVTRKSNGNTIFDTTIGGFVFENQFIQIVTKLSSTNFYGLGENLHKTLRHDFTKRKRWAAFTRDTPPTRSDLSLNLYGVHPFYLVTEDDGKAHGVFFLNSNAMEYEITPAPYFVYRTIGGILDMYYIVEDSPEMVIRRYHELIGKPYMPPLWALGFQLCRYGFKNLNEIQAAVNRTLTARIPLDVFHADIDHMDERKDFTIDPVNFKGLSQYLSSLRNENGIHTIIILDPFLITNETNYRPFDLGKTMDAFIRWSDRSIMPPADYDETNSTMMLGFVWPKGKVVFPDYLRTSTKQYWNILITEHHKTIKFDGLWIDMNEPANFGTNQDRPFNWPEDFKPYWSLKCPKKSKLENPPYRISAMSMYDSDKMPAQLSDMTICMDGEQGDDSKRYSHYNVHSLYGWSMTKPTLDALRNATKERGLVLSRSTYPSSGHYAGHWLGDNDSEWPAMAESIIGMIEFNFFGYPYVGADICGFFGDTTEELCTRWMQLGAFYPFSRNHNSLGQKDQDPGLFSAAAIQTMRHALEMRYRLLPLLYTLFMKSGMHGGTVVRPLFFEYPTDKIALGVDEQFMWGPSLIISPILRQGQRTLRYYLPSGVWYRMTESNVCQCSGTALNDNRAVNYAKVAGGQWYEKNDITLQSIPELHLRAGHVIFTKQPQITTTLLHNNKDFHLIVALNDSLGAEGELMWDDSKSIDDDFNKIFHLSVKCTSSNEQTTTCKGSVMKNSYAGMADYRIASIVVLGTEKRSCSSNSIKSENTLWKDSVLLCQLTSVNLSIASAFTIAIM